MSCFFFIFLVFFVFVRFVLWIELIIVIEFIFNYQGIGQLLYSAAQHKDFPLLQAGVMVVGVVYLTATLLADLAYSLLNPRIRHGAST